MIDEVIDLGRFQVFRSMLEAHTDDLDRFLAYLPLVDELNAATFDAAAMRAAYSKAEDPVLLEQTRMELDSVIREYWLLQEAANSPKH